MKKTNILVSYCIYRIQIPLHTRKKMKNELANNIRKPFLPKNLEEITSQGENIITDDCIISGKLFQKYFFPSDTVAVTAEFIQNAFKQCTLDRVRITSALFRNNKFDNCSLANADFNHSKLERMEFNDSKLLGASFAFSTGADLSFIRANCQFADFRETKFRRAFFEGCNLREADFQGADLRGATFQNCDLRQAQFSFALLNGTNFCESNLEGIRVQPESLRGAIVDYHQSAYLGALLLKLTIR